MDNVSLVATLRGTHAEERVDRVSGLALALTILITELAGLEVSASEAAEWDEGRASPTRARADIWRQLLSQLESLPTTRTPAGDEGVRLLSTQLRERLGEQAPLAKASQPRNAH